MKNATKHAEKLRSAFKALLRDCKPAPRQTLDPLRALVRGAMLYDMPDGRADEAMKAIDAEFVDLNELRVATDLEIHELLGVRYPQIEKRVEMITRGLNQIFEKEHTLSLDRLKTLAKRDARQVLRGLPDIHPFVEAYVMLYAFDGNTVPVDHAMLDYLISQDLLEAGTSLEDAQKFLEHNIKAEEAHDLFVCLRQAANDEGSKPKKKIKA